MATSLHVCLGCALAVFGGASSASAAGGGLMRGNSDRPTNDYGHEFVRVGRPGNRAALPSERVWNQDWPDLGAVGHRYRIAKTEVTATQWLEFVDAYWPHWEAAGGHPADSNFTSTMIRTTTSAPGVDPGYYIVNNREHSAPTMSWYVATRYCNWLHNSKVNEEWAFETGAYDTSTFGNNGAGYFDDESHLPGAKFWIPTLDEWTKATYYDPNRYGQGMDGYWTYMAMQNEPLMSGVPGVGETSAGNNFPPGFQPSSIPVGSYPDIQSPWGLLDTSGTAREWTETLRNSTRRPDGTLVSPGRLYRGSEYGNSDWTDEDLIDIYPFNSSNPGAGSAGLRLASSIPSPATALPLLAIFAITPRRSRTR